METTGFCGKKASSPCHTFHGSCLAEMFNVKGIREKLRMGILALCEYNACLLANALVAVSAKHAPLYSSGEVCNSQWVDLTPFSQQRRSRHRPHFYLSDNAWT